MSKIHQINLLYDPLQDRALLRVNTSDACEIRFWLTRRFVQLLWPNLVKLFEHNEVVRRQPTPEVKREVLSFQHHGALEASNFKQPFAEKPNVNYPLGDAPLLVTKAKITRGADGRHLLVLCPANAQTVQIALTDTLLHSLCKLLADTANKAGWGLSLTVVAPSSQIGETERYPGTVH